MTFHLPSDSQRHAIYGKTGSGKTVAGLWALEKRNWQTRRWEILDFKRDPTIAEIPRLPELDISEPIGKEPGLFVRRPLPGSDVEVEAFLWDLWGRGNCGLMLDEGYEIRKESRAWRSVITQGRALKIPLITLSQRPAWLSPFLMSETDFHQVFYMQKPEDLERLGQYVPADFSNLRQDYRSIYYDVPRDQLTYLAPVPPEEEILERFAAKMPRRFRLFKDIGANVRQETRRAS